MILFSRNFAYANMQFHENKALAKNSEFTLTATKDLRTLRGHPRPLCGSNFLLLGLL